MNIINKAIQAVHGSYTICVKNTRSGNVHLVPCDNIPVIGFTTRLYSSYYNLLAQTGLALRLAIGDGSIEPSTSDTALTHELWRIDSAGYEQYFSSDFRTYVCVHTFTIPASTSYIGNISELGVYRGISSGAAYKTLITHSLLKDAEGHPYTIAKSDLDEITITYSISVTYDAGISVSALSWYAMYTASGTSNFTASSIGPLCEYDRNYVPGIGVSYRLRRYAINGEYALIPIINGYGHSAGLNNPTIDLSSNTPRNLGTVRVPLDNCLNGHFIFCLYSEKVDVNTASDFVSKLTTRQDDFFRDAPLFAKNLPDASLFATSTLQDYSIGIGDGVTQDYTPPIPVWLDDTEKVYIDGVQQIRGVDYTCDSKHNLQSNIELMPLGQAFIADGYIVPYSYFDASNVYIYRIYICATDLSYPQYGDYTTCEDIYLSTRAVHKDHVDLKQNRYFLCMDNTHPFIFDLADEISKEVDEIYLYSYYDNDMTKSRAISISLDASNDKSNWTAILNDVSAKGSSSESYASRVPIADWAHYPLQSRVSYKYWRMRVAIKGMVGTNDPAREHSLGFILMRNGSPLHFNTAPAANSVITMDCDINIPYKDDKHVIDVSAVITM
jgi:hypothetical protein